MKNFFALTHSSGGVCNTLYCPLLNSWRFPDPYVKIYLHYENTRSAKKKTHIKKRSLNPVFNESFIFDLPSKDGGLEEVQLEVIMCDWDRITKNEVKC